MEINNCLQQQTENLLAEIEDMIEKFQMLLININDREIERIDRLNSKKLDSQILSIIELFMIDHERLEAKIRFIKGKVEKSSIKISFFGTVSAGKSRVLNTILGENLFLSAVSDTTSCFVKVNKSDEDFHYIQNENSEKFRYDSLADIKTKVKEMSTNLGGNSNNKLNTEKSVELFLNIQDNKVLRQNTQIVDTPGSNNKDDITSCIKEQSLDSDIFIFVMTYTLTNQEKDFFLYQSNLSSKPDVFILVNKWDKSDNDKPANTEKSKEKIKKELTNLLVKECNFSKEEAWRRIYFVSALETYKSRVEKVNIFVKCRNYDATQLRYDEFNRFEECLSNYIDHPEKNKLDRHVREVTDIKNQLIKSRNEFKNKILQIENNDRTHNNDLIKLHINLEERKNKLKERINAEKGNIFHNINLRFQELKSNINQNNLKEINVKLNIIPNNVSRDLIELQNTVKELMKEFKGEYEGYMGKYDSQNKQNKPTLTGDLNKNIVLKMIPERSILGNIVGFFKSLFGNNDDEKDASNILRENIEKIDTSDAEINKYVNHYLDNLEAYVTTESNNMIDFVWERLDYITGFWKFVKSTL